MTAAPTRPKLYHITPVANLASIAKTGLLSDAIMVGRGGPTTSIGMAKLKTRRFTLAVSCHPGDHVADYVPFYFCPRSPMLYMFYMNNHRDLTYRGGQEPIVHLEADMHDVIEWAGQHGARWAFTSSNASSRYAESYASIADLDRVDWSAIHATQWQQVKETKQAEFLVRERVPWELVSTIGVCAHSVRDEVEAALTVAHKPPVIIRRNWYYP